MDLTAAILETSSLPAAAKALGVTLSDLLAQLAAAQDALDQTTKTLYHESMRQLYLSAGRAIEVLRRATDGETLPDSQIDAAKSLLVHAAKAREYFSLELELARLEALIE